TCSACAACVPALSALEGMQVVQARRGCRELGGVDVAVHPERRLVGRGARRRVGDGDHLDVASFVALPDGLDGEEGRLALRESLADRGQLGVAVETVETKIQLGRSPRTPRGLRAAAPPSACPSRARSRRARARWCRPDGRCVPTCRRGTWKW